MKIVLVTQVRIGSTRLPGKILKQINGESLLEIHLKRLKRSKKVSKIIVATTFEEGVQDILSIVENLGLSYYQGSIDDVLDRFYHAVKSENPDWVVRVTSDCPLVDPNLADEVIDFALKEGLDYASNVLSETYPDGQDIEVFRFSALSDAWKNAQLLSEREHVTPYIRNSKDATGNPRFRIKDYPSSINYSNIRMTVDEEEDFELIERLIASIGINKTWKEYVDFIVNNGLQRINEGIVRNEGYLKSLKED